MKALIFDLDGTIVDTEPVAVRAVAHCFGSWGFKVNPSHAEAVAGRKWEVALDFLLSHYQPKISRDEVTEQVLAEYRRLLAQHLPIVPGSAEAVRKLAKSYPLALVSGSHRSEIEWILTRLGIRDHFQFLLGAEDYSASKPDPEGYHLAQKKLGVSGADSLVFEDSDAGIASALAAGHWVVAVRSTNHYRHAQKGAHAVIEDFTGVDPQWVRSLGLKTGS